METPRQFADKIWGTEGYSENTLKEFDVSLSTAIGMIENYSKPKDEAINKALEVFDAYFNDGGEFYGSGIFNAVDLLKRAQTES